MPTPTYRSFLAHSSATPIVMPPGKKKGKLILLPPLPPCPSDPCKGCGPRCPATVHKTRLTLAEVAINHAFADLEQGVMEWMEADGNRVARLMKAAIKAMKVILEGHSLQGPAYLEKVREFEKWCGESNECDSGYGSREITPSLEQIDATQTASVQTSNATTSTPAIPVTPAKTYADVAV